MSAGGASSSSTQDAGGGLAKAEDSIDVAARRGSAMPTRAACGGFDQDTEMGALPESAGDLNIALDGEEPIDAPPGDKLRV